MNCFQIGTFMWWVTGLMPASVTSPLLWIAFKLVLLCDESQVGNLETLLRWSCELLSNWYFYVMSHRSWQREKRGWYVVNCFQIGTFMWWVTGIGNGMIKHRKLWIAFKLVLLCDESQAFTMADNDLLCCELLSNWYFYVMSHRWVGYTYTLG